MSLRGVCLAVVLIHGAAHTGDVTEDRKTKGQKLENKLENKRKNYSMCDSGNQELSRAHFRGFL